MSVQTSILARAALAGLTLAIPFSPALHATYDLRQEMPAAVFEEAGLDKLSPEELEALNAWVGGQLQEERSAPLAQTSPDLPEGDDAFGLESVKERVASLFQSKAPERIESTIEGTFTGWEGDTVFRLANGQVWKQVQADSFYINVENPKVTIKRAIFGSYLLSVEGFGSSVRVRRVE